MVIFRTLAGLVLGLVIFAGLMYSLVFGNFSQRLEDPEVYNVAISDTDAYNRIYDEVLLDDAMKDYTADLLGGVEFATQEDVVDVLKDVMTSHYLKEQTENNIERFTGFLVGDYDVLNIFIDLEEPLNRVEPAVLAWVYREIDDLEIKEPVSGGCSQVSMAQFAAEASRPFSKLSDGELPQTIPSLRILTKECRADEYDEWYDRLLDAPAISSEAARILQGEKNNLRKPFVDGDTREFFKQAATPLVSQVIEDAVRDIRRDLSRGDRLDVLGKLAENSDDFTRDDINQGAESLRNAVSTANGTGRIIALVMVIVGSILLAVVYIPKPGDMMRWPGVALLLGGGVCLVTGILVNSAIPGRIKDAIVHSTTYAPDVPTAAIDLAGDLMESFVQQSTSGFIPAATTVLVIGALLVIGSFFANALWAILRGIIPGSGGNSPRR